MRTALDKLRHLIFNIPSFLVKMRLYTKTGDNGTTGTLSGRVGKDSSQVSALGALDTLHAHLAVVYEEGLRTLYCPRALRTQLDAYLLHVMHDLLDMGTHISALYVSYDGICIPMTSMNISHPKYMFSAKYVPLDDMEAQIDAMCASTPPLSSFILHTGCPLAAYIHVARCACRAAEASTVAFLHKADLCEREQIILMYLNRLSDYLFALARLCTHAMDGKETVHTTR